MILLAAFPPGVTQRDIQRKLAEVDARSETAIDAVVEKAVSGASTSATLIPENAYVLTATGSDQIGIVARVTEFCVHHQLNILDLSTTVAEGAYVMILIVDLTCCTSIAEVRQDLQQFGRESGLKVVLQHHHIFRAVNEINLPIR
jgi:predicted amino acid-binding ACT domain protein